MLKIQFHFQCGGGTFCAPTRGVVAHSVVIRVYGPQLPIAGTGASRELVMFPLQLFIAHFDAKFPLRCMSCHLPSWSRVRWWSAFSRHALKLLYIVPLLTLLALVALPCRFATMS